MKWTAESLSELATGYWRSQALLAASELGVFRQLPGTAGEVCGRCGIDLRVGEMLLESLAAMGVVDREGATYSVPAERAALLGQMAGALAFNGAMYGLWGKLPEVVRAGRPAVPPGAHLGQDEARTRGFVMGMHSRGLALLPRVAAAIELEGRASLLDVGAGAGTLGRMLAEANPGLRVTLADLPGVTRVARELTAAHPAAGRVEHVELDYLSGEIPAGHDAIVHCGALHQHDEGAARGLVAKLARALATGGELVIVDLFASPDRGGTAFSLLFGLNMALVSPTSRVHSLANVAGYMRDAGLEVARCGEIAGSLYGVARGRRR